MKQKTENIPGTFSKGILAFGFWVIAFMLSAPCPSSAQQMEIGTNFWARVDWTGELPFKNGVNFSSAWNSGIGDDHLVNENVWNEAFLEEIEFYTVLRFMDWVPTNKSPIQFWHQRRLPTDQGQTASFNEDLGIAYEWMGWWTFATAPMRICGFACRTKPWTTTTSTWRSSSMDSLSPA